MLGTHPECTDATGPHVLRDPLQGRPTVDKATVLQRREFIYARCNEYPPGQKRTCRSHLHIDETSLRQNGLHRGGGDREDAPHREVAGDKGDDPATRFARAALSFQCGKQQDGGRRAGQHHPDHHHRPHQRDQREVDRCVGQGCGLRTDGCGKDACQAVVDRHAHHARCHTVHAFHLAREMEEEQPGEQAQRHNARPDDKPVPLQGGLKRHGRQRAAPKHRAEKRIPVFGKSDAKTKDQRRVAWLRPRIAFLAFLFCRRFLPENRGALFRDLLNG